MNWYEHFKRIESEKGGIVPYFISHLIGTRIFLRKIIKYAGKSSKILEAGCGTAHHSIYLSYFYDVTAIDNNKDVIKLAKEYNTCLNGRAKIMYGDIFTIKKKYDIIFHFGVLEHFDEEEIKKILKKQLSMAKYVIFLVPTSNVDISKAPDAYGDERLWSISKWHKLINDAGGKIVEKFGVSYLNKAITWLGFVPLFNRLLLPFAKNVGFVVK